MDLTRAIKFEVEFAGVKPYSPQAKHWNKVLFACEQDLREAANRTLEALYLVRRAALPVPTKDDGKPVSLRTLSYQALSGKWQPFGEQHGPLYQPKAAARLGSRIVLAAAGLVFTRVQTDFKAVENGEVRLPVFRRMALPTAATGYTIAPDLSISLSLWARDADAEPLPALVPYRVRGGQLQILRRIARGELKAGDAKLVWHERKKKWLFAMAWTGPVELRSETRIAGVDLGQIVEVNIGYIDETGAKLRTKDFVPFPEAALRVWDRIRKQYRQRQQAGIEPGSKLSRVVATSIQQLAARVVQVVKQRKCGVLVLEDLRGFASDKFDETEALPARKRAAVRAQWLRWHYGAVREQVKSVALREGLTVVVVEPGYTTMTCSECGRVWLGQDEDTRRRAYALRTLPKLSGVVCAGNSENKAAHQIEVAEDMVGFGPHGRHTVKHYSCSCGFEDNTKLNAAWNIARRGQMLLRPADTAEVP